MITELFPGAPVITLLSERSDGEMGSSLNPGPKGEYLTHRGDFLKKHDVDAKSRLVLAGLVRRSTVRLLMNIPPIEDLAKNGEPNPVRRVKNVDGLISYNPEIVLGIVASDCYPVFLYYPVPKNEAPNGIIGILHAGRDGVLDGIISTGINTFFSSGAEQRDKIMVAIGPGICAKCHVLHEERDERTLAEIRKNYPEYVWPRTLHPSREEGLVSVDILGMIKKQLLMSDVLKENINDASECTACPENRQRFFSFRRDRPGREAGVNMLFAIGYKQA